MKHGSAISNVLVVLVLAAATPGLAGEIRWATGASQLPAMSPSELQAALTDLAAEPEARHVVVQFDSPILPRQRRDLAERGVTLLNYVDNNAYFAAIAPQKLDVAGLRQTAPLATASAIELAWKMHPFLYEGNLPTWAVVTPPGEVTPDSDDLIVGAYVLFHRDVILESEGVEAVERHGAKVRSLLESINGAVIDLPFENIPALAAEDAVQWVEPPLPKMSPNNDNNRLRVGADVVQAPPYSLNGTGVTVMVYDAGTGYSAHQDFGGRLHVRDTSGEHYHSTHVAGTVGGSGAQSSGTYKGMAPGVIIESYGFEQEGGLQQGFLYTDPGDIEADYSQAISTYGADIANNSIGTNTAPNGFPCEWEGNYGVTDVLVDTIVRGDGTNPLFTQPFRVVWANGNERQVSRCGTTYHTTAPPACGKNHITVGALNSNNDTVTSFTSWGPADDGRMKPDISAPGCQSSGDNGVTSTNSGGGYTTLCGTSMACPTACGLGALLLQDYRAQYPGEPDFRNSTLKCFFAHTAVDLFNAGPDYQTGYGSIRIQPAIDLMRSGNFLEDEILQVGQTFQVLAIVNPTDTQLKITLAWDDFPDTPNANPILVNDLDLRVFSPSNVRAYPWTLGGLANPGTPAVQNQENHVDNIEQVFVNAPETGAWRIEVYGYAVPEGPQPFSLTVSPMLVACSPAGFIMADREIYACEADATLQVVDCDLNTSNSTVETVLVTMSSASEPAGESVLLTETGPETATFRGTLQFSQTDGAGILLVGPGETVTATYIDADNGQGGQNVVKTDTAVLDCTAPLISNVQASNVQAHSATISCTTGEPAIVTIRYGNGCGSLTLSVTESNNATNHSFNLSGLNDNATYFFAVDAVDPQGNQSTDDNGGSCYAFSTPAVPEPFTEAFTGDNDLDNSTIQFTPNGSLDFYAACVEPIIGLPTDPTGGTTLSLANDSNAVVSVGAGQTVKLYGTSYSTFYVGSNGYITFNTGDNDPTETLADHFNRPRISALFDDLNPTQGGGSVSWKQLADRVAVTWLNVPEHNLGNQNTLQIEMFFDGRIVINYLAVAATDGLAGLSQGTGVPPDYLETNLSAMGDCGPRPPNTQPVAASTPVSTPVMIALSAIDDGLPDPPAALSYVITLLPAHGTLSDPNGGAIVGVPYTLLAGGNQVLYSPQVDYRPLDTFQYQANDGGVPPQGGDSNVSVVMVALGGPQWDPVAANMNLAIPGSTPWDISLTASDPNLDPLTYIIESLPAPGDGLLADPNTGVISTVPHTLASGNVVQYLPPFGQVLSGVTFNFSARDATAGSNVATVTLNVGQDVSSQAYFFSMDTDPGWSTEDAWAWGVPSGGGSHYGDPQSGYTGSNVYGYNLNGDYANNMPIQYLTTTAIDLSVVTGAQLKFRRWLGVEAATFDHAAVEVSNDGTNWTTVWNHTGLTINESSWSLQTFDISAVADQQATVYISWSMGPTDGTTTYPGWNIDDVEIWGVVHFSCADDLIGDVSEDGSVDGIDVGPFVEVMLDPYAPTMTEAKFCAADVNQDGFITSADLPSFVNLLLGP